LQVAGSEESQAKVDANENIPSLGECGMTMVRKMKDFIYI